MTIEHLKTSDLIPYARNAKKHDASQVAKIAGSIREFGFNNPVLIDKDNGIIAGHGRVLAAQSLALKSVPCIRLGHLTDTQRRAYILADNRLAEIGGGWDEEMLKLELADLAALDVDVAEIGFGAEDLAELEMEDESETSDADAEPQIDKAEELRAKWGVEPGQLWEIGDHRLLCGDSTIPEHVAKLMGREKAELLFTSPPYADMREYKGGNLSVENLCQFITAFKPHANYQVVNLGIKRHQGEVVEYWQTYISAAKASGYKLLSWNVWDQGQNGAVGKLTAMFPIEHEWIFIFGEKPKDLIPTIPNKDAGSVDSHVYDRGRDGTTKKKGAIKIRPMRELGTIERVPPQLARNLDTSHPAMFPIRIVEDYAQAMTNPGDIIAEPFSGSGTTIMACEQLGRKCRAIEISPAYVAVAIQRWADATGKEPKRLA